MPSSVAVHLRRLAALAVPVTAGQMAAFLLNVVDIAMLGRVGVEALDAAALGRVWSFGTNIFVIGLLFGIDPLATQAFGAGDRRRLDGALGSGLVLALLATVPLALLWSLTTPVLVLLGQPPEIARAAGSYVAAQLPGLPFFMGFMVLKQVLQAQNVVLPAMWIAFVGNGVNVVANWALIFGRLGLPELGVVGAGLATSLTFAFLFVALAAWMTWRGGMRGRWGEVVRLGRDLARLREVARLGWPVSIQLGLEMWAFQIATLMAGRLGHLPLAAHTVALMMASVTFMMPLGISLAAAVRVGNLVGARQHQDAQRASWVAFGLGGGVMLLSAVVFWFGRAQLPRLFTPDPAVVLIAATILPVAAAFQVFDGVQVVGGGVLRGMGQTRPAAVFNLVGYYGLALPLAWWLGFRRGLGVAGVWWGLALGLGVVAILVLVWIGRFGPARRGAAYAVVGGDR